MTPFTGDLMPLNHITRTLWVIAFASLIAACGGGDDKEEDMLDVADVEDTADTANDSTPDFLTECTESADCTDLSRPNCVSGRCVQCIDNNGCEFDFPVCSPNNQCVPCSLSTDCEGSPYGPVCDLEFGVCVECVDNTMCDDPVLNMCDTTRGVCVECEVSFDCADAAAPACSTDGMGRLTCQSHDECMGDDSRDSTGDDGPAAATDITPAMGMTTTTIDDGMICTVPFGEESDWFVFDVVDGDNATITLDWQGNGVDLDLSVYDAGGVLYGDAWYGQPEVISLTYLPAGQVYVHVTRFDEDESGASTPYSLTVEVTQSGGCGSVADCAAEWEHQAFRGDCQPSGACTRIDGQRSLQLGETCDSPDDCNSSACTYGQAAVQNLGVETVWFWAIYTADAAQRAYCANLGNPTMPCDPPTDYCTGTFGAGNYCSIPCEIDDHCPINRFGFPAAGEPWQRLRCDAGRCVME